MSALSITILICASAMPKPDYTADNAIAVLNPNASLYAEYSGLPGCEAFGQRYVASLSYMEAGADGKQQAYPKIMCRLGAPPRTFG